MTLFRVFVIKSIMGWNLATEVMCVWYRLFVSCW